MKVKVAIYHSFRSGIRHELLADIFQPCINMVCGRALLPETVQGRAMILEHQRVVHGA